MKDKYNTDPPKTYADRVRDWLRREALWRKQEAAEAGAKAAAHKYWASHAI